MTNTSAPEKKKAQTYAIAPRREEDFAEWYQQVIKAAKMAENSDVRGCMVILPWGYAVWENIQKNLDSEFKRTGHENVYFPLLIPLEYIAEEAEHVEGFAKECAVVTHTKLGFNNDGKLVPQNPLESPYIIRPTSETIIGHSFAKWISSYRDLPVLINQWCNVMRWEMRTRIFLRTSEFLWQEGHTAHATSDEALNETFQMLEIYNRNLHDLLAIPAFKGQKTPDEKFPGADLTFCVEAMMQDGKALQAGTSHFLGQNFSKAQNIRFLDQAGEHQFAYTTSWGSTTRMIGALIMTHADDNGMVMPPKVSPLHVVISPIFKNESEEKEVREFIESIKEEVANLRFNGGPIQLKVDNRDLRGGEKYWQYIKQGVPLVVEIGPKDVQKKSVCFTQRTSLPLQKQFSPVKEWVQSIPDLLNKMQDELYQRALDFRDTHTFSLTSKKEFEQFFSDEKKKGFVSCFADEIFSEETLTFLKSLKVTARCIPLETEEERGICIFTGKNSAKRILFAKSY